MTSFNQFSVITLYTILMLIDGFERTSGQDVLRQCSTEKQSEATTPTDV